MVKELQIPITHYCPRNAMQPHNIPKEKIRTFFHITTFMVCNEVCHFTKIIH